MSTFITYRQVSSFFYLHCFKASAVFRVSKQATLYQLMS